MAASLQACGVVFPFAISTSICRSKFTICSGLYLFIGMTGLLQVNSLSFHLVQKSPVRSQLSGKSSDQYAQAHDSGGYPRLLYWFFRSHEVVSSVSRRQYG